MPVIYLLPSLVISRLADSEKRESKLLGLYLSSDLPKEMLTERKQRLEQISANLLAEKSDLTEHISQATVTDDQLTYIEEFCAKIRSKLNQPDFDTKRQIFELLDVRCKMDYDNGEKALWLKCLIEPQGQPQLLWTPTSPLSSLHWQNSV